MKITITIPCAVCLTVCLVVATFAHEVKVHERISGSAVIKSTGFKAFVKEASEEGESAILKQFGKSRNPAGWIIEGSAREDDNNTDEGGRRPFGHFYDPLNHQGLSSAPGLNPRLGPNSYEWGSRKNSPGFRSRYQLQLTRNVYSWQNARDYQYRALTRTLPLDREASFSYLYRSLGQVIHLLQDASSPQHVRNEHHWDKYPLTEVSTPWRSPLELYGADNVHALNYTAAALDWRAAGFNSVRDFWDRDQYTYENQTPNPQGLTSSAILGLAELVNGNFLGERHVYAERFNPDDFEYYPFPSLEGTDWTDVRDHPGDFKKVGVVRGDMPGPVYRVILEKKVQGLPVLNHAAVQFMYVKSGFSPAAVVGVSIDDPDVLANYHAILIPMAVSYSAGLLDYFFRGRLEVLLMEGPQPGLSSLRIVNKSGQRLLGGNFELYRDGPAGSRTLIQPTEFTTTYVPSTGLADGGSITADFVTPTTPTVQYMLVYKGTLIKDGTLADPVDKDICVIAKRITCVEGPGDPIQNDLLDNLCPFAFNSLTVQNLSEFLPHLPPCATCSVGSPLPQWDGTIPKDPGVGPCENGGLQFFLGDQNYQPIVSLGGSAIKAVVFPVFYAWEIEIVCAGPNQSWQMLWRGHKTKGYSPRGTYIPKAINPGCTVDKIPCITIE